MNDNPPPEPSQNEQQTSISWNVDFNPLQELEFSSTKECEEFLSNWALEQEFSLTKQTTKSYSLYLECSRGGRQRKLVEAEGK